MSEVFIHPNGLCETASVGGGTRVWAFAHILPGAKLGRDCNICDGVFVESDVIVGDRVTVKCGVQLWNGLTVEDDVFIGPNATFTNDPFPRSKAYLERPVRTVLRRGSSIGANATILPGIEIGAGAMIGAGAVVTRSVPPNAIVVGNPARIVGYTQTRETDVDPANGRKEAVEVQSDLSVVSLGVGGATLHQLRLVKDMRGDLTVGEYERDIPFTPKRYFLVFNVLSREVRGEHAHKSCHQFLICLRGSCNVLLDDGMHRTELTLDRPSVGVYMPPMIWGSQFRYSPDAMLLVFASDYYDPTDYIRNYSEFRSLAATRPRDP